MKTKMENKIICGSCQEELKKMENSCIDLTVTSPPYDNIREYKGYSFETKDFTPRILS